MNFHKPFRLIIPFLACYFMAGKAMAVLPMVAEKPLVEVLKAMQKEYEIIFSYNTKDVKNISVVFELKAQEEVTVAINRALQDTGLKYKYLGLNFYTIYKNNSLNKRKIRKIERKIKQIKRLGKEDNIMISNHSSTIEMLEISKDRIIKGRITDENDVPLIGVSILVDGTQKGTTSDLEGNYQLNISKEESQLIVSYIGYRSKTVNITDQKNRNIQLEKGFLLEEITVFGSRGAPRTNFDSPVPIDHISIDRLKVVGKNTLDEQLAHAIPSFFSGQHPVSDASAHFNPIDLRGLLPSRTLVLVNGKRKNTSALLYSYVTASRGEVGVDLKSIAPEAIQSVEVLRDGATAQYGSDAIAGVLNLVLKEKIKPFVNVGYNTTSEFDGTQWNLNTGFSFDIKKQGFVTFTLGYFNQQRSQRAGTITNAEAEANYWGTTFYSISDFESYLNRNPSAGFQVGLPNLSAMNLSMNGKYTFNQANNTALYFFGSLMSRTGRSPQFARGPYWVQGFEDIYPNQDFFLPEMAPKIADQSFSMGLRHIYDDWHIDISTTLGNNEINYFIKNSFNQSLGKESPRDFYNGAHTFKHLVNNVDVHKTFYPNTIESLVIAFGAEQRLEVFETQAGEFASYGDGTPDVLDHIGSESFSGLQPKDEGKGTRNNVGFYTELTGNISPKLQIGGATRYEHYSDFGKNLSWKMNALFRVVPKRLNVRTSMSNGFRAPSLHQIYYASTTTTLTPKGIVQNRILNNLDPALAILDIPKLKPETSFNLGVGLTYRLSDKIGFSTDAYHINIEDRIVLSGQIGEQAQIDSPINQLLKHTNTGSTGFFLNAVNTTTKGIDLVINFDHIKLRKGSFKSTIAANFSQTKVKDVHLPTFIEGKHLKDQIFSREDISRIETWRPRQKIIFSSTYSIKKMSTTLAINHFGSVTYKHPTNPADDATYGGKTTTDWSINYTYKNRINWQVGIQNLFNIYPDTFSEVYSGVPNDRNIDFVGRFKYPWQTIQIGIDGVRGFTKLSYTF